MREKVTAAAAEDAQDVRVGFRFKDLLSSGLLNRHTATHCNTLQRAATRCNALQHMRIRYTATRCNTLQRAATCCNALQRAATHED